MAYYSALCYNLEIMKIGTEEGCFFCDGMNLGGVTTRFPDLFPNRRHADQVLLESDSFYLTPDDAPITPGHLLAITKSHILSCAQLDYKTLQELETMKDFAADILMDDQHDATSVLFFEHGPGRSATGHTLHCGACGSADHAHLHIVPLPTHPGNAIRFITEAIRSEHSISPENITIEDLPKIGSNPYLYLEENGEKMVARPTDVFTAAVGIPSQYIRLLKFMFQ